MVADLDRGTFTKSVSHIPMPSLLPRQLDLLLCPSDEPSSDNHLHGVRVIRHPVITQVISDGRRRTSGFSGEKFFSTLQRDYSASASSSAKETIAWHKSKMNFGDISRWLFQHGNGFRTFDTNGKTDVSEIGSDLATLDSDHGTLFRQSQNRGLVC